MPVLKRYTQQPADRLDRQVSFERWMAKRTGDSIASYTCSVAPTPGVFTHVRVGNAITPVVGDGTAGTEYKVTIRVDTTLGRRKEVELIVVVQED